MSPRAGILIAGLMFTIVVHAASAAQPSSGLAVSPEVQKLLQAEMQGLLSGTQIIAKSLPLGDWDAVAATAAKMKESYVLEQKLTDAQRHELEGLPQGFRALDEEFHDRAEKLKQAATARDARAVSAQFGQLLQTCVACHASFASQRLPGFSRQPSNDGRK